MAFWCFQGVGKGALGTNGWVLINCSKAYELTSNLLNRSAVLVFFSKFSVSCKSFFSFSFSSFGTFFLNWFWSEVMVGLYWALGSFATVFSFIIIDDSRRIDWVWNTKRRCVKVWTRTLVMKKRLSFKVV